MNDRKANPLLKAVNKVLTTRGFQKKSDNWLLETSDVIALANLQKSQYGQQYYVNLGIWIKVFGENVNLKEHQCQIRFRLESVLPEDRVSDLKIALNMEDQHIEIQARESIFSELIDQYGLSILKKCSSLEGIKRSLDNGELSRVLIQQKVKDFFQIKSGT
jgi:hypothetical protein